MWVSSRELVLSLPRSGSAQPIYCLYPDVLKGLATEVIACLPRPFFAVKANTLPRVIDCLVECGFRHFDIASLVELRAVRRACSEAVCAYMNPVKQDGDIREAYDMGVRMFALDSVDEFEKILRATAGASGCTLIVRLALLPKVATYDMTGKFGATQAEAAGLLHKISAAGLAAGLTFHVGSQCEDPQSYAEAVDEAAQVAAAGVSVAVLDVGGGFPARYRGTEPELARFGKTIVASFEKSRDRFGRQCVLQSEPGRSLVAASASVLVRVELRRGNVLFINEGLHGLLSELRWMPGFHPLRKVEFETRSPSVELAEYSFAGPTCDSGDFMKGPYSLPNDMRQGDWIEIGFLGAYCVELVTPFNGFGGYDLAEIRGFPAWES